MQKRFGRLYIHIYIYTIIYLLTEIEMLLLVRRGLRVYNCDLPKTKRMEVNNFIKLLKLSKLFK